MSDTVIIPEKSGIVPGKSQRRSLFYIYKRQRMRQRDSCTVTYYYYYNHEHFIGGQDFPNHWSLFLRDLLNITSSTCHLILFPFVCLLWEGVVGGFHPFTLLV